MAIYRGVVKGNIIVLDRPTDLPDGSVVEVRPVESPVSAAAEDRDEAAREDAFEQHLLRIGFLKEIPASAPDPPGLDRTPIRVRGRPISETIIEERR